MSAEHHGGSDSIPFYEEIVEASSSVWEFLGQIFLVFLDIFGIKQPESQGAHH